MNFIFLGDSLMQNNDELTFPQLGWPQMFPLFVKKERKIGFKNFAKNGRSTKSFINERIFEEALNSINKGDLVFISFGHNDEKKEDETRYTRADKEYIQNLEMMYLKIKEKGAESIFLTSVSRLKYNSNNVLLHTHLNYPSEMKKLALKLNAFCIDLESLTYNELSKEDYLYNSKYYMILKKNEYDNYKDGLVDTTHLNKCGALFISFLVYKKMKENEKYKEYFI